MEVEDSELGEREIQFLGLGGLKRSKKNTTVRVIYAYCLLVCVDRTILTMTLFLKTTSCHRR